MEFLGVSLVILSLEQLDKIPCSHKPGNDENLNNLLPNYRKNKGIWRITCENLIIL